MTESAWRSRVRGLLADTDGRVLLAGSGESAALPSVELAGFADDDLESARRALEELAGSQLVILRQVARTADREAKRLDVVYALERLGGDKAPPPGVAWHDRSALGAFAAEARDLVERERASVPETRAPWARPGWFAETTGWIETSLRAAGREPSGRVEQVRSWPLSCVLRTPTADGFVYFKATAFSPYFVDEGRVTRELAKLLPENVPAPLAVDSERRWMLLEDLGTPLGWEAPEEQSLAVFELFGRMQANISSNVDVLLAAGCIDRRPAWLADEARALLADDSSLAQLEPDEVERLRSLEPLLDSLCERLERGAVPASLVHGDLHLGNVAIRDGAYVFFDWTDACVSHPFLDLILLPEEEDARDRLRDAYLGAWRPFASRDELLALWSASVPLASLNQAVSYRHIFASLEPGSAPQLEWALPHWLRKVLATVDSS